MKKKLITFTLLLSIGFSQVSVDDLKNINNQKLNSLKDSFRDQDNLNESFTEPEINQINFNGTQEDKDLETLAIIFLRKILVFLIISLLQLILSLVLEMKLHFHCGVQLIQEKHSTLINQDKFITKI